ncbi:MAG: rhomboid family intramembrane serine protease [Gemmataceae bacterium]
MELSEASFEYDMSADGLHPLETILQMCAAAAPEPWYPRLFAKQEGVDPQALGHHLEELWLSGLIERKDGGPEKGPAISLSREGQRVLLDPEALWRLRNGQPVSANDRGTIIRQALYGRMRAGVTVALILTNVLVFAWGYFSAREKGVDSDFLRGNAAVKEPPTAKEIRKQNEILRIQEKCGLLSTYNLIDGQWQRLLTAGFVHFGFLHLLMNVVFLYLVGRFVEPMWGHLRYLLIYLASVLGGSCLAAAHNVGNITSASEAVWGLLGAEAVWFIFNRRYLPRALVRPMRTSLLISLVMLFFIGPFKGVGGWGLVGGFAAGAITALLLQLNRFGPPLWRWLALLGFAPPLWYGHFVIEQARLTNPEWQKIEDKHFEQRFYPAIHHAANKAREMYQEKVEPLVEMHPTRRDAAKVETALPIVSEQQQELKTLAEQLANTRPYVSPDAEQARHIGREYVQAMAELFAEAEHNLRVGDKRTDKDRRTLRQQEEKTKEMRAKWKDLFE